MFNTQFQPHTSVRQKKRPGTSDQSRLAHARSTQWTSLQTEVLSNKAKSIDSACCTFHQDYGGLFCLLFSLTQTRYSSLELHACARIQISDRDEPAGGSQASMGVTTQKELVQYISFFFPFTISHTHISISISQSSSVHLFSSFTVFISDLALLLLYQEES